MDNFGYHGGADRCESALPIAVYLLTRGLGRFPMESNERYYRRRAAQELAAARRAVTESAMQRRTAMAESFLRRLSQLTGVDEVRAAERDAVGEYA